MLAIFHIEEKPVLLLGLPSLKKNPNVDKVEKQYTC